MEIVRPVTITAMLKKSPVAGRLAGLAICFLLLSGCSPTLDWREVRGDGAPYTALFPAKPAVHSRNIMLDGSAVDMTMQGAEVEGVTYAIGTVSVADAVRANRAAAIMQEAMVRNIAGNVLLQKSVMVSGLPMAAIVAEGKNPRGEAVLLHARFAARGTYAYQAIVLGPVSQVTNDAADTFLESFKPDQ